MSLFVSFWTKHMGSAFLPSRVLMTVTWNVSASTEPTSRDTTAAMTGAKRDLAASRPLAITSRGIQGAGPCKYLAEATNLTYSPQLWERPSIGTTVVFSEQPDQQALTPRVPGDVGEVAELADSGAWGPMAEGGGDFRKDGDGLAREQIVESLGGVAGGSHGGGAAGSNPLLRQDRLSNQMRR